MPHSAVSARAMEMTCQQTIQIYLRPAVCVARLCHDVVTTRRESGESIGDSKRRFVLVRYLPELFLDNENHAMSDWGSSHRRFKSCQSDHCQSDTSARQRKEHLSWDFLCRQIARMFDDIGKLPR